MFRSCQLLLVVLICLLPKLVTAGALRTPAPAEGGAGPGLSAEVARQISELSSEDSATRVAAVKALGERGDPNILPLLEALREGSLYVWVDPQGGRETVIAGAHTMRGGEAFVPLFTAYGREPLRAPDGAIVSAPLPALEPVEADRRLRQIIKPLLDSLRNRVNLSDPDPITRRSAATDMGNLGNPLVIPWLEEALATEDNRWTRHAIEESIHLLKLSQSEPSVRRAAATRLGEIRALRAAPELTRLLAEPGSGESGAELREAMALALTRIETWRTLAEAIETVFRGFSLSSILLLMALGLAVIFGLMGVINMAHGELMMVGAYTTFVVQECFKVYVPAHLFDTYFLLAMPLSFVVAGVAGLLLEVGLIRFLYGRPLETLLATWGVSLILIQAARKTFGDLTAVASPNWLSGGLQLMVGVQLPYNRLFILALSSACVTGMYLLLFRTQMGLKVRAVTQNRAMSACLGVSTRRVDAGAFALGAGLAGLAGCALTQVGNVDPALGQNYIVDSFLVVVTGGVGKLAGTALAALGIGGLNKLLEPGFGAIYAKILILFLVIVFLQRRPAGLFMTRGRHAESEG